MADGHGKAKRWLPWLAARAEALLAWLGFTFVTRWGAFERGYRRPYADIAMRLRFGFYPLLALAALAWLGWDWTHDRNLASAENAIFDQVISMRPFEPPRSGKVARRWSGASSSRTPRPRSARR